MPSLGKRDEAIRQEDRTKRKIRRIIDKEITSFVVVGANLTTKGNLTFHIKNFNGETAKALRNPHR